MMLLSECKFVKIGEVAAGGTVEAVACSVADATFGTHGGQHRSYQHRHSQEARRYTEPRHLSGSQHLLLQDVISCVETSHLLHFKDIVQIN